MENGYSRDREKIVLEQKSDHTPHWGSQQEYEMIQGPKLKTWDVSLEPFNFKDTS